jgi:hypothetical protein
LPRTAGMGWVAPLLAVIVVAAATAALLRLL